MKTPLRTFFFAGFLLSAGYMVGQISISPNPVIVDDIDYTIVDIPGNSIITNESGMAHTFTWTRSIISMTETWETAVCDITMCYLPFVESQSFVLGAGAWGNLDIHVYPNNTEGSALIQIYIEDDAEPVNSATGIYYFNQALSAPERLSENIKTYPNPVADILNIEAGHQVHRIEIFNIEGKRMLAELVNGNSAINLSGLPSGTFILRMFDGANQQISGNLLVKQ